MSTKEVQTNINLIHSVISDLDAELNWMKEEKFVSEEINIAGHTAMIKALDNYCNSIGQPCANYSK